MKHMVSILFLLLANVFMLVHAVVPHHHHDSSHHHDGPETCIISQSVASAVVRHCDDVPLPTLLAVFFDSWEEPTLEAERIPSASIVSEAVFRPHRAHSLRAPPLC
ncbi:MAG: hypothetical protein IJQ14_05165 [Bacteroidales bacterium]|nr:hypothetical protein [Bacteroidales bacterium]